MSKAVNSKWKKTFPDTIGNQNRPATGVDDTQEFETGAFPQYMANDPVRYDLQNAAMSQSMSNDARLKEMVDARGKELDDHKVDPGAHKTGIAGNAATATKVVTTAAAGASANIAEATMAGSDSARIRVSGDDNAGELALETADNGDEAIVARQYTGTYTNPVRTAKILDESGNTSFPGTVVAPKFTGTLNGNAATASKLATPRTLSLTGKATGSTTFDGSANATINVTSVNADTASKLSTARKINISGDATGAANFDGTGDISINTTVNESKHAVNADTLKSSAATETSTVARPVWLSWEGDNTKQTVSPNLTYTCSTKTLKAANFAGHLAGNADSATNADTVDGYHENSFLRYRGDAAATGEDTLWNQIGIKEYNNVLPESLTGTYAYGAVVSFPSQNNRLDLWYDCYASNTGTGLYYRTGWANEKKAWARLLDSNNYTNWAPTKTGTGASGTWGINITGNAATATTADNAEKLGGYALNTKSTGGHFGTIPKVGTDGVMEVGKYIDWHSQNGGYADYTSRWEAQNNGTVTVGTINGTLNGNAATATNADKLDGYHASDLFRHLGGNQTPVITDIFDRAGTIDMSTMSAADKATHKANINKAPNMTQNIWNNGSGIHAYGGDADMAGYNRGTLKLTQSYKNFDKILVVGVNDRGDLLIYKLWDVWALANAFASGSHFQLFRGGDYWLLYGSTRKGTNTNYVLSTDTVWSCQDQNSGIVAIYGIKY